MSEEWEQTIVNTEDEKKKKCTLYNLKQYDEKPLAVPIVSEEGVSSCKTYRGSEQLLSRECI
jgi:hypothetical protein